MVERAVLTGADGAQVMPDRRAPTATGLGHALRSREFWRRRPHWLVFGLYMMLTAVMCLDIAYDTVFAVMPALAVASAVLGLRLHRPEVRWPWVLLALSAVTWAVSNAVGALIGAPDDLSADRSLWPDLLAIPGYLLVAVAVTGLASVRGARRERAALIDGLMVATAMMLVVWEALVVPVAHVDGAWLPAQVMVVAYPVFSAMMLVTVSRLAFSSGGRSPAFLLLLAGVFSLHVGDVMYALSVAGLLDLPVLSALPYLLTPAFFSTAALHPMMRGIARHHVASQHSLGAARIAAVIGALSLPTIVFATRADSVWDVATIGFSLLLAAVAIVRVIVAMREQALVTDRMYHRATHDELTGLPSRNLLNERLGDLVDDPDIESVTLMFVDLDRFKLVNDTIGHNVGDEVLMIAAKRVCNAVRSDDTVFRIAGDEFVVVLPDVSETVAKTIASRIREVIRTPMVVGEAEVFVSASIGYTSAPTSESDRFGHLLREADEAMYRSKESGRDTTTRFDVSMRQRTERRVEVEHRLRRALEQDELSLHYQPIVSGDTWSLTGFEALARWITDAETIAPDEFIPVAEESGLIVPIGQFVLESACAQLASWRREHAAMAHCSMSVNVSSRQIRSGDIVDVVAEALRRHDLPGDALWLEITETVMVEDSVTTAAVLNAIRSLGVRLSVDDFGTGYSSLGYLKRFPVSRVKIDRSFVHGMCDDDSDRSLVSAVVAMATALGLETVAEGVETPDQALILRDFACESMQGYLFGRPLPPEELVDQLAVASGQAGPYDG